MVHILGADQAEKQAKKDREDGEVREKQQREKDFSGKWIDALNVCDINAGFPEFVNTYEFLVPSLSKAKSNNYDSKNEFQQKKEDAEIEARYQKANSIIGDKIFKITVSTDKYKYNFDKKGFEINITIDENKITSPAAYLRFSPQVSIRGFISMNENTAEAFKNSHNNLTVQILYKINSLNAEYADCKLVDARISCEEYGYVYQYRE